MPAQWKQCSRGRVPDGYSDRVARRFDRIRTARLVLRRWSDPDRDAYAAMNADPAVMRYFPATLDRAASDAHVDRIEERFGRQGRSEEHTSELQSLTNIVCRLL